MGVRSATKLDLVEELGRVKRHIDLAVFELAEARDRLAASQDQRLVQKLGRTSESEMASLCITLELALADAVVAAQRLAERVVEPRETVGSH